MKQLYSLFTFLFLLGVSAFAQAPTYSGGDGTKEKPFLISNEADLQAMAKYSITVDDYGKGQYFKQTADIAFKKSTDENVGNFWGIAGRGRNDAGEVDLSQPLHKFQGTYDGGGHYVTNYSVINLIGASLFNCLGESGIVQNLRLKENYITSTYGVTGAAVAVNFGLVKNCYAYSTYYTVLGAEVGGLVGSNQPGGIVQNCYNLSEIYVNSFKSNYSIGGVVGNNNGGKILSCVNLGEVNGLAQVGGIVGTQEGDGTIVDCYNGGIIKAVGNTEMSGGAGIVGAFQEASADDASKKPTLTITNCYNYGTVTVENQIKGVRCLGTIVGIYDQRMNGGTLTRTNCYSDKEMNNVTEDDVTLLSSAEMKAAVAKLNGSRSTEVFVSDMAKPINNGYPILAWQKTEGFPSTSSESTTTGMHTQFAEITIPIGSDFNIMAFDHKKFDDKKSWNYSSADTSIVEIAKNGDFFIGKKVGQTTLKKIVYTKTDNTPMDSCEFKVNVIPEDQYKPECFLPCMDFGKTRQEIFEFEKARGNKVFTEEYFDLMNTSDADIEVILTNNPFIPVIFYIFTDEKYSQASLLIPSTYLGEAPQKGYDAYLSQQDGFKLLGVGASGSTNVYYNEKYKMVANAYMLLLIQGGLFTSMEFVYDPDKSVSNQLMSIENVSVDHNNVFVKGDALQVKTSNGTSEKLYVYNAVGQCVYSGVVNNGQRVQLPKGLYIVRLGSFTTKAVIRN